MSRSALLTGRTLADVVTNMFSVTVMVVVGLLVGFRFTTSVVEVLAGLGVILAFGYAFSWIFAFVGLTSSSPESAQSLGFIAIFPLTFVSSAFVPIESMASWLQGVAEVNPITITVDAVRGLFIGTPYGSDAWLSLLWSVGLTLVFAWLSVSRYRRSVTR